MDGRKSVCVVLGCGALLLAVCLVASPAKGVVYNLQDRNSFTSIDLNDPLGQYTWLVDGYENLYQQWFWFRTGDTAEASIDTLTLSSAIHVDSNFDGNKETLTVKYLGTGFEMEIRFKLTGNNAGSGKATLSEQIKITNTGGSAINDFNFFQYADFNLVGTPNNDTVAITSPNTIEQTQGSLVLGETINTANGGLMPTYGEVDFWSNTLTKLTDGDADDLNVTLATASFPVSTSAGNVTWAFQWVFDLAPGQSYQISKIKRLEIPEPATMALLGAGAVFMFKPRRRRQA